MNVTLALPELDRDMMARVLQDTLQSLAKFNADWVMNEWAEGRTPKCCAKCYGTKYIPPTRTMKEQTFASSPILFRRGYGACGEIAACHTGHKIAEGIRDKGMSWNAACANYRVVFDPAPNPAGDFYFHAICDDNGQIVDPTIGMTR